MSDKTDRRTASLLAGILTLHFAVRLAFFSGLQAGDDLVYSHHVQQLFDGTFSPSSNFACRIGFIFALTAFRLLFGVNEVAHAAFNLLCSAGTALVAYGVGKQLLSRNVGLFAALATAVFPLNVVYSTDARPDVPASFFLGLGLYLFLKGQRESRTALYMLSGSTLFAAYLVKEVAIFAAAVIGLWMLVRRRITRGHLYVAGTFLTGLILEGVLYLIWTGDFLRRFHVIQAEQGQYSTTYAATTSKILYRAFLAEPNLLFNPLGVGFSFVVFFPILTVLVGIWAIVRRRDLQEFESLQHVLVWWIAIYGCLSFWPLRLIPYIPAMHLQVRMLEPLTIPMMVLSGFVAARLFAWRQRVGVILIGAAGFLSISACWITHLDARTQNDPARIAYNHIRSTLPEGTTVLVDSRTRNLFLFWDSYQPRYRYELYPDVPPQHLTRSALVLNPALEGLAREDHVIPGYVHQPLPSWTVTTFRLPGRPRVRKFFARAPLEVRIYVIP